MLSHTYGSDFDGVERWRFRLSPEPPRLRTVVIDDSAMFLEVACALLERDDELDVVARGRNGREAVDIVAKLSPDLVVMDIDMPQLDGLTAALIISCSFPSTRIILMSAEDSYELRADCMACGAEAFVHKPRFRQEFPLCLETILTN